MEGSGSMITTTRSIELKGFAIGINEFALQRILWRERHRVKKQVQFAELLTGGPKDAGNVFILGHVTRQDQGIGPERARQLFDILLYPFALISEGQGRARLVPGPGDSPRNRPFVGDAKDNAELAGE